MARSKKIEPFAESIPEVDATEDEHEARPGANPPSSVTYVTMESAEVSLPSEMAKRLDAALAGRKIAAATWRENGLSVVTYPDYQQFTVRL